MGHQSIPGTQEQHHKVRPALVLLGVVIFLLVAVFGAGFAAIQH